MQHIKKGYSFVALDEENELYGYVLFSITQSKGFVRVMQLCVDDQHRYKGVAVRFLDYLKDNSLPFEKGTGYQETIKNVNIIQSNFSEFRKWLKKNAFFLQNKYTKKHKKI